MKYLKFSLYFSVFLTAILSSLMIIQLYYKQIVPLRDANTAYHRENTTLSKEILSLKDDVAELSGKYEDQREENKVIREEISTSLDELDDFEKSVNESLSWFRENKNISYIPELSGVQNDLESNCVQCSNGTCSVKLSCIVDRNEYVHGFEYEDDIFVSDRYDFLQSLSEFYANQKGDCEDFSVLVVAELRAITESYRNDGYGVVYESFEPSEGSNHFIDFDNEYYYPDMKDYKIPSNYQYYYPVCGSFPASYDLNLADATGAYGHCLIGFSNYEINEDNPDTIVAFLKNALLVEPQTGMFEYNISTGDLIEVPESGFPVSDYYLNMIITDEDLLVYDYYQNDYRWYGYGEFDQVIEGIRERLLDL